MDIAVIANGVWDAEWGRGELKEKSIFLIGADGGANLAIAAGKIPNVLIGDFDSITEANFELCLNNGTKIEKYPREKDQTDLELALGYAEAHLQSYGKPEDEILLYAAGGNRLDHLLGNIALMLGYAQKGRTVKMLAADYQAWVMLPGSRIIEGVEGQELSIVPLAEKAQVSSRGFYYELNNLTLWQNSPRGISNVFNKEQAVIEVHEGIVLVIILLENTKH